MEERILSLLSGQAGITRDRVDRDTRIEEELGFDSLDMVEVLAAIEDEYGVYIPDSAVPAIRTAQDLIECTRRAAEKTEGS